MYMKFLNDWSAWANDTLAFSMPGLYPPAPSRPASRFIAGCFFYHRRSIDYKIFIPSTYRNEPVPLVVMLHGCGQDAADFAGGTGMNELAERHGFLVAYPEQSPGANWNMCWNWFDSANQERDHGEPALIAALTHKILDDYAVDERRVSVAGLSSGGAMAVILGRTYPDIFSAVGCHSGLPHGSATNGYGAASTMRHGADLSRLADAPASCAAPIIVFHGDDDATVHRDNGDAVVRQSLDAYAAGVQGMRREVTNERETGQAQGRHFTRSIHRGEDGGIVAEHWAVQGAGHAWSGGCLRGSYTDARGPDASQEMLRFFIHR